ncbi:hypothetical protein BDZ45DRAFT_683063 [Acephala macrosclerotiorum]|nr:hypothetical protein BDZ45DRAFT_683063 [Acephala macrosclerotiorum]
MDAARLDIRGSSRPPCICGLLDDILDEAAEADLRTRRRRRNGFARAKHLTGCVFSATNHQPLAIKGRSAFASRSLAGSGLKRRWCTASLTVFGGIPPLERLGGIALSLFSGIQSGPIVPSPNSLLQTEIIPPGQGKDIGHTEYPGQFVLIHITTPPASRQSLFSNSITTLDLYLDLDIDIDISPPLAFYILDSTRLDFYDDPAVCPESRRSPHSSVTIPQEYIFDETKHSDSYPDKDKRRTVKTSQTPSTPFDVCASTPQSLSFIVSNTTQPVVARTALAIGHSDTSFRGPGAPNNQSVSAPAQASSRAS